MLKKLLTFINKGFMILMSVLILTGCDRVIDKKVEAEVFDKCLMRAAEARKGTSYTTHDDEDYDEVIRECRFAAEAIATIKRGF